ncbi:FAD-binding oxidoreductase (plasmid) [Rhodobacteraceae bacterium SC52]|nr:FAD-binding oxidoreductase [Rhodobacteraceae bacterium SC52]
MSGRKAISLWDVSAQEHDYSAPMPNDVKVDVAIVGGGFTGLSTALHCAEKGLSVHVLEAEHIGFGGSGRNVGLVNPAVWVPPKQVSDMLGPEYGPAFIKKFGNGPKYVFSLIEKHQIQCEATKTGTIHAAHAPKGFRDLQNRHAEWQRLGEPVDLLNRKDISRLIGSEHFYGGLVDHRAGTINPMGYCRGLARAARGAGAEISTGVRAKKLRRDGAVWKVETSQGTVTATSVILGTNAYTDDLWPGLSRIFTPIHYFQMATKPLGPDADHILPGKQGVWDTGQIMFSVRRDAHDRMVIGSMGKIIGNKDRGLSCRWARKQIAKIFPTLGPVEFDEAWHGKIAMTPDHLPRIYELDTNLYTPIGYNGRGITTGTIFGESMAGLLTGMNSKDLPLPITDLKTVPSAPFVSRIYQSAFTANQLLKSL